MHPISQSELHALLCNFYGCKSYKPIPLPYASEDDMPDFVYMDGLLLSLPEPDLESGLYSQRLVQDIISRHNLRAVKTAIAVSADGEV